MKECGKKSAPRRRYAVALPVGVALLLLLSVSVACADHEVWIVEAMQNVDPSQAGIMSVSASCRPAHNREQLECYFASFSLMQQRSDEELRKQLDEFMREVNREPAKQVEQMKRGFCLDEKPDPIRLKYNVSFRALLAVIKKFCDRPSKESAMELAKALAELDAKKCRCTVADWRATFTRQVDRWVSNSGPDGLCGVVRVSTLIPKYPWKISEAGGPVLWRLDERSVVTRPDDKVCKTLKVADRSISLSFDGPSKSLECDEIQFNSVLEGMSNPGRK
jgi:hypothetical protein